VCVLVETLIDTGGTRFQSWSKLGGTTVQRHAAVQRWVGYYEVYLSWLLVCFVSETSR